MYRRMGYLVSFFQFSFVSFLLLLLTFFSSLLFSYLLYIFQFATKFLNFLIHTLPVCFIMVLLSRDHSPDS